VKWVAIVFALILALALAKAVLTVLGFALVLALACALIFRPRQTLLLVGEVGLFCLALTHPWTAVATAVVLVVSLSVLKRLPDRPHTRRLRLPPS
jgi:hypothetical protein